MASAVLAIGNESGVGGFMGKLSSYLNSNPNPKKKQKQFHHQQTTNGNGGGRHNNKKDDSSPAFTQTASDDAYSFIQKPAAAENNRNGFNSGGYLTYSVSSYSKSELVELRKRLSSELEQIRNLRVRIESGQFSGGNPNKSQGKTKKLSGIKRPQIPFRSAEDPKRFSSSGYDNVMCTMDEALTKECRQILTKLMKHKNGWIFNTPVDAESFGLHDYHLIVKRPMDLGTVKSNLAKNLYPTAAEFAADVRLTFNNALLYNPKTDQVNGWAGTLLAKFEDMFRPMQQRIDNEKSEYFGDGGGRSSIGGVLAEELQGSSWNHIRTPERPKKPKALPILKKHERMQTHSSASTSSNPLPPAVPPKAQSPEPTPSPKSAAPPVKPQASQSQAQQIVVAKSSVPKQPKPRAKDLNKREMSMEEKHKLGVGLQSLPQEKMPQLVQIIRKRNEHLAQEGDEIELDIEALDTETLWELDRFVTNWKKMVSKTKRQALMLNNSNTTAPPNTSTAEADMGATSERNDSGKKPRKGEAGGDEDVDIDDDLPATNFPPVEIEKDEVVALQNNGNVNASSSSSSSGSSSSDSSSSSGNNSDSCLTTLRSREFLLDGKQNYLNAYESDISGTDSDSGSSSGSESDADEAQS